MKTESPSANGNAPVWDLPLRIFHWALAVLVVLQVTTASIGGNAMQYHAWGGYAILALVAFRILWGFLGGAHARFSDFVRGPRAALAYLRGGPAAGPGHNPLGGWSVLAMLASLLTQAVTGLFASDDIMMDGPLAKHVSGRTVEIATAIHDANAVVLLTLVGLHVAAILFYLFVKKRNLTAAMVGGGRSDSRGARGGIGRAAVLLAASAAAVYLVVTS